MKNKLLFLAFYLTTVVLYAQTSSNTCTDASNTPQHIDNAGTFSIVAFDGTAPTTICTSNGVATNGEWFMYTPSNDYTVTVSSDIAGNDGSDTRLHIYDGNCASLNCIASSDDVGTSANFNSRLSTATFNVTAGQTYYIAWDNYWLQFGGDLGFSFELTETDTTPIGFSSVNLNTGGTFRAVVDMNNDFLDDIVSIVTRTVTPPEPDTPYNVYDVNIQQQQVFGGFTSNDYMVSATYSASWSLAAGDINNDGYNDLVFGNGSGVNIVRAENNGTSYTVDTATGGIFTQRTNFVDINSDGHLDVFVCHDVAPNVYYINDENNKLTYYQGSDPNGVPEGLGTYPSGGNYGSVWVDYDNDRDIDMFMAKCGGSDARRTNQLFRNNGNSSFTEVGVVSGLADVIQTWSAAWGDFDNDGDMDCFIGGYQGDNHKMMRNNNDGTFTDVSASTGIDALTYTGIENVTADFNNDGFIDIFSNGNVLLNDGNTTMSFTAYSTGMPPSGGVGDLNNDGFLDVYSSRIYYNDGNTNNWIKVNTVGVQSNKSSIGARVEVSSPGFASPQIRDVRSGDGFRFMSSLTSHFGLGTDATINSITVYWPSGAVDIVNNPSINQSITIVEGTTLSLQSTLAEDLILYPNPTNGLLNISTTYNLENAIYTVFDLSGKRILNSKLSSKTIDVSMLSTGNYFLRIMVDGLITTQKFIKE